MRATREHQKVLRAAGLVTPLIDDIARPFGLPREAVLARAVRLSSARGASLALIIHGMAAPLRADRVTKPARAGGQRRWRPS